MKSRINFLTFFGLLFIALGTYLISFGPDTHIYKFIFGLIAIIIGSYLTYLGGKKDIVVSEKTIIATISKQVADFRAELRDAQNSASKEHGLEELENISTEFDDWAKQLDIDYPELALSHEKSLMNEAERLIQFNKEWNPFFLRAYQDLVKMADAMNNAMPNKPICVHKIFENTIKNDNLHLFLLVLEFNEFSFLTVTFGPREDNQEFEPRIMFGLYDTLNRAKEASITRDYTPLYYGKEEAKFHWYPEGKFKLFVNQILPKDFVPTKSNFTDLLKYVVQFVHVDSNKK